jgi:hypothetical protein
MVSQRCNSERRRAVLAQSVDVACAAEFEICLGNQKAVVGLRQRLQAPTGGARWWISAFQLV